MDRIVESLLGFNDRSVVIPQSSFEVKFQVLSDSDLPQYLQSFAAYLETWNSLPILSSPDILNLRDDLLGHIRQVLYLMTLM